MKNFCIVTNLLKDPDMTFSNKVRDMLEEAGASVTTDINGDYECIVVLGGDGTIIDAVRSATKNDVMIVGINLGHLGFLSSVEKGEVKDAIKALILDDFDVETRMMIEAGIEKEGRTDYAYTALNDVVINRMGYSGMITSDVYVNGSLVNSYFSDGVIISTPTGSTGYNLSAGGPIVTPEAQLMVITPICPHSLNMRSVVVGAGDSIRIVLNLSRLKDPDDAVLAIDGKKFAELGDCETVNVRCSNRRVRLVRFRNKDFFKLLYMKLGDQVSR